MVTVHMLVTVAQGVTTVAHRVMTVAQGVVTIAKSVGLLHKMW